ncbi:hypothetical protein F4819DRAFT_303103 [Hypoxylon fuscum]|nr:hypothetical protein F4819DRAFT_303103 [Hypoxylon fuscum]
MSSTKIIFAAALAFISSVGSVNGLCRAPPPELDAANGTEGLKWTISVSHTSEYDGKEVKIRPNHEVDGAYYAAVDDYSPTLLTTLRAAVEDDQLSLFDVARDGSDELHDLGPTGFLNMTSSAYDDSHIKQYSFGFANVTQSLSVTTAQGKEDGQWQLKDVPNNIDGMKRLDHYFDVDMTKAATGWSLCSQPSDDQGEWRRLFYMVSPTGNPWKDDNCIDVSLHAVKPGSAAKEDNEDGC